MADLDKAKGVIYGLAIGDALGRPTEFMSADAIKINYGPEGVQDLPEPALFTPVFLTPRRFFARLALMMSRDFKET